MVSSELNTKYYYASTVIRRWNSISKLKSDNGEWLSGRPTIGGELVSFYQQLFLSSDPTIPDDLENLLDPVITSEDNDLLTQIPDGEEIYSTL